MVTKSASRGASTENTDGPGLLKNAPPQSVEAEKGVLGSLLLLDELCDEVATIVRSRDFYYPENQAIFRHLLEIHEEGKRIDITLLYERLKQFNEFDSCGGAAYLEEIVHAVPTAANAIHYAQIVRDKSTLRDLISNHTQILREAADQTHEPRELLAKAEAGLFRILEDRGGVDVLTMEDVLHQALERIEDRLASGGGISGVSTGLVDLDGLIGGLHESELIILAGRPSMGKTALAMNIAEHVAIVDQQSTLFVSLEMSRLELAERMLCSRGRINSHKLRSGFLSSTDHKRLVSTAAETSSAPLFINDSPSMTMTDIAATARRLKRRQKLKLLVIDYLQLIEPDNDSDPRQEQVARIARRLKGLARELKIPVLCLAQLNRQAEVTRDNRPRLSHLRESGAIEQDADVVMFVHRDEYYATTDEERAAVAGQAMVIVAKQRNGPTGEKKVRWTQEFTRFENLAESGTDFGQF